MSLNDLIKRFTTSITLILLLGFSFFYSYILIITLLLLITIAWNEFRVLIFKIFKNNINKILISLLFFIYLVLFSYIVFLGVSNESFKIIVLYLFIICILSDVGGLLFGNIFKGKKLTKISPNKTISGSIGSFILSLLSVPMFYFLFENKFLVITFITLFISFVCQLGDLFFSFLKRKANVKDTGKILPGHGGLLDRIDGILFAIPIGIITLYFLIY